MKNILTLFIALILVFSCSKNDDINTNKPETTTNIPTALSFSPITAKVRDTINISGKNFNIKDNYTVKFNDVDGEIIEIKETSIKVIVPENATSGKLFFIFEDEKTEIGTLEIAKVDTSRLFAYVGYDKIVELNPTNGSVIKTIATLGSNYFRNIVYSQTTNDLIALQSLSGTNQTYNFARININSGKVSISPLKGYEKFIITNKGKLYAYVNYDKIVELNPTDGSVIKTIATLGSNYFRNIVYSQTTNELIALESSGGSNQTYNFTRIDISSGEVSKTPLKGYEKFIITNKGKLYAYVNYDKIVELNPTDGSVIKTIAVLGSNYFRNIVYSQTTNELIALESSGGSNQTYNFTRIDINSGEVSKAPLKSYEKFIIAN